MQGQKGNPGEPGAKGNTGAPGPQGPQGERGPSNAYADGPNFALISPFGTTTAATLTVPAGSYVVSASLNLEETRAFRPVPVQCNVGTTPDDAFASDSPYRTTVERDNPQTLSFTRTLTVASGEIELYCRNDTGNFASALLADAIRLTAVRVGTLENQ